MFNFLNKYKIFISKKFWNKSKISIKKGKIQSIFFNILNEKIKKANKTLTFQMRYNKMIRHFKGKEILIMKKYVCDVCGWEYDPAIGDADSGIEPGTAFEDLPEDFVCPPCSVGKDMFSEVE